ncbi:MAG: PIG-L family deacetylase [Deltaproteobacteria bacterium]|nr:PIG-L family deacetylase [Deltaproteobacteria bacterium]
MRIVERTRRTLAIGAHPDDLEVGAGGLLARLARTGEVTMVIASVPNRFEERLAEAREGARRLGAELVVLEEGRASRVDEQPVHALVSRLEELLAQRAPDLVLAHGARDLHADHTFVHRATIAALGTTRTRCDVLAYGASPDLAAIPRAHGPCFADISDTIEVKLAAIAAHASQFPTADAIESRRDHARAAGRLCGATYAEPFELHRLYV